MEGRSEGGASPVALSEGGELGAIGATMWQVLRGRNGATGGSDTVGGRAALAEVPLEREG